MTIRKLAVGLATLSAVVFVATLVIMPNLSQLNTQTLHFALKYGARVSTTSVSMLNLSQVNTPMLHSALKYGARVSSNVTTSVSMPTVSQVSTPVPTLHSALKYEARVSGDKGTSVLEPEPMALSFSYWEQTANAMSSLFDLQCWAQTVNISKVLQPSIDLFGKSSFHFSPWDGDKLLQFEDLFDLGRWNNMSLKYGYSQLVSLDYFLQHAVRDVVFVSIRLNYDWHFPCHTESELLKFKFYKFLLKNRFRILKYVCIDFKAEPHYFSAKSFQDQIFNTVGNNVTVFFHTWVGIQSDRRIRLPESSCKGCLGRLNYVGMDSIPPLNVTFEPNSSAPVAVSSRISNFTNQFISKHMSGDKYVAVMMRTEKLHRSNETLFSVPPEDNTCAQGIISDWKKMVQENGIGKTLVLSDIGEHGSARWDSTPALKFSEYIQDTLKAELPVAKINTIFEDMTGSKDSVQIAILHQQLVARATCAILVGGGGFHTATLNMYSHNHREHHCAIIRDHLCSKRYVKRVHGQTVL